MTAIAIEETLDLRAAEIKTAALIFRAINNKLRQQILQLLHQNSRMTVTSIRVKLHFEQPVASAHLAILRKAGLVDTKREGKCIFYSVNYKRLQEMQQYAAQLVDK